MREPRPAEYATISNLLMQRFFACEAHVTQADGSLKERPFVKPLREYLDVLDFGCHPNDKDAPWRHFCCVVEGSDEHLVGGLAVGGPCSNGPEQAVTKVATAVSRFLFGSAWRVTDVERWLQCGHLLARFLMGSIGPAILPQCMSNLLVKWDLTGDMAAALERIVAADKEDWHSRRKLRALRDVEAI